MPLRRSRSRKPGTPVSIVTTSAVKPAAFRALQHVDRRLAPAAQIHLIPRRAGVAARTCSIGVPDSVERTYRGSRFSRRAGRQHFAVWIEHAAAADRGEHERQFELRAEDRRLQIDGRHRDGTAGTERQLFVRLDVVAERDFGVGAAVDVIEHNARQAAFRHPAGDR